MKTILRALVYATFSVTLVFVAVVFLSGCGKHEGESSDDGSTIAPTDVTINDASGTTIGYFMGFTPNLDNYRYRLPTSSGHALILLKKTGEIVEIDLMTGAYVSDRLVCAESTCTSTKYTMGNVMAKQVLYVDGQGYFKTSGKALIISVAACLDKLGIYTSDGCAIETHGTLVSSTTRPYDFTSIAPIVFSIPSSGEKDKDKDKDKNDD